MKKIRLNAIIALLLVCCTLLTSCSWFKKPQKEEPKEEAKAECQHENASLRYSAAATCIHEGYTGDLYCPDCDKVITPGETIPFTEHSYDEGVTTPPTCVDKGVTTYTCTVCATVKLSPIDTVEHSDEYHSLSSTEHQRTCGVCGLNENGEHTPTDEGTYVPATCVENAYTEYTCSLCQGVYRVESDSETALGDHAFSEWITTVDSSCTADGVKTRSCTREGCSHTDRITIPKSTGHFFRFREYITLPTCVDDGLAIYACQCGATTEETVSKTGIHSYGAGITAANGFLSKECSVCSHSLFSYDASASVSANIPTSAVDSSLALEMSMKEANIEFPADVVAQITDGSSVTVSADVLDNTAKANAISSVTDPQQLAALENAPIYDFTVRVDDRLFSDSFSNKVAITVSYDNGDNDTDGIVIYYIAENGEIQSITDVVYNAETKEVSFFVEHFSYYAVAYAETQAMKCRRGNHTYEQVSSQTATCFRFGYVTYECICCHDISLDNISEKLEHNYGSILPAEPTCESPDHTKRICLNQGCGDVILIEEYPAIGHSSSRTPTCTDPSRCENDGCGKILAPALGHSWTDWITITPATSVTDGLRKRSCTRCNEEQSSAITATGGNVESIEYDGYTELVDALIGEFLEITSGEFEFVLDYEDTKEISAHIRVEQTTGGYKMAVSATVTTYYDVAHEYESWSDSFEFYYENGAFIVIEDGYAASGSDIDAALPLAFELFDAIENELYAYLDEYVNSYLMDLKSFINEYSEFSEDKINEILAEASIPYTLDSLASLIESIETVYAYLSARLGFDSMAQMRNEIAALTPETLTNVLGALITPTQNGEITTYTISAEPFTSAALEIANYLSARLDNSIGEFIYDAIGNDALEYDETLTDFDKIIDVIEQSLPGTLSVSDAIDKYETFADENGSASIEQVYAILNLLFYDMTAERIDFEELALANGDKALDELIAIIFEDGTKTLDYVYDYLRSTAADTLGNAQVYENTVSELEEKLRRFAENNESFAISFSANADGEFTGLSLGDEFWNSLRYGYLENIISINSLNLTVTQRGGVTVDIPSEIAPLLRDVSFYYDTDGNLVIEGLDPEIDYDFSIVGNGTVTIDDIVIKDQDFSNQFGFDVYVLEEEYWSDSEEIGTYIYYNGNYYLSEASSYRYLQPTSAAIWREIENRLYGLTSNPGSIQGYLKETGAPVYSLSIGSTEIAIFYRKNGEWTVSTQYGSLNSEYYVTDEYEFENFLRTVRVGMATRAYQYECAIMDGVCLDLLTVNVSYGIEGRTAQLFAMEINGNLLIITGYQSRTMNVFSFTEPLASLPTHSFAVEESITAAQFDVDNMVTWVNAQRITLYSYVPTYYVRVTDGIYSRLDSRYVYSRFDTTDLEELTLPDGNTLYIIGSTTANQYGYEYGYETFYGYATTASGVYIQTAAFVFEGEVVEVRYRNTADNEPADFNAMFDLWADYLTVDPNGNVTISKTLINTLKRYCDAYDSYFAFRITATVYGAGFNVEMTYDVGAFSPLTDIDLDTLFGNSSNTEDTDFWRNMFGSIGENSVSYSVDLNSDGSVTVTFDYGTEIKNISYSMNTRIPVENVIDRNDSLSSYTGLDVYSYESSYTDYTSYEYVYRNGKYYSSYTVSNYDLLLVDDRSFISDWDISSTSYYYIGDTYEQYKLIGVPGVPDGTPVYTTRIVFDFSTLFGSRTITLYTFFVDDVMNVAVEAEATGNSLLTFESFMPLGDYMKSLRFEISDNSSRDTIYYRGEPITVYASDVYIFETDGAGNKLNTQAKYNIEFSYVMADGSKKYIRDYRSLSDILIVSDTEADLSFIPSNATATAYTSTYYNGTFSFARFTYQTTYSRSHTYICLAGRYYRYDDTSGSYREVKLTERQFNEKNLNLIWFFKCENTNDGSITYSTEFIPSDDGFILSGDPVDITTIQGRQQSTTLLGYTAEGYPIYEVLYLLTTEVDTVWTEETQSDGTVFLHKDGVGYLRVSENGTNYYVRANKVAMPDGSYQIYCHINEAVIYGSEISGNRTPFLEDCVFANGRELTIRPYLLDLIQGGNKNFFEMNVHLGDPNYTWQTSFTYYVIEGFFMS